MDRFCTVGAMTLVIVLLGACDPTVDAFEPNELQYSIFGYLNASADTQFIRVEPLRDGQLIGTPDSLDVSVRLTNLDANQSVSLRDSLFRYGNGATAHNFFTTAQIRPRTEYRLTVRNASGEASQAQTTVPDTFPRPVVGVPAYSPGCSRYNSQIALLSISGVDRLVALNVRYHTVDPEGVWTIRHLSDTTRSPDGTIVGRIFYDADYCQVPALRHGNAELARIDVIVAAAGADWPEFHRLAWENEALPTTTSNVTGGVGLVVGIVTDTVEIYSVRSELN